MSAAKSPAPLLAAVLARPRAATVALLLVLSLGLSALQRLPRREDPEMVHRAGLVVASLPGASADRVDSQIAEPLSEALRGMAEVENTRGVSRPGIFTMRVILQDWIQDSAPVFQKVRARLDTARAQLPPGTQGPVLHDDIQETEAFLYALAAREAPPSTPGGPATAPHAPATAAQLGRLAEDLEDALRRVDGVGETERYGDPGEVVEVRLSPQSLRDHHLTAGQVAAVLRGSDVEQPAGRLEAGGARVLVRAGHEWTRVEQVAAVVLVHGDRGETVRVGDIAEVARVAQDPPPPLARLDGRPAVVVSARLGPGHRVDVVSERVAPAVEAFAAQLPAGVELRPLLDQGAFTRQRIDGLTETLLQSVVGVTLITALFLGLLPGLLVASILPICALAVLVGFQALGVEIQQMSISSLVLAMGLVIDAAIVVAEHVGARIARGEAPAEAAANGVAELRMPLLMSTLTTISAFLPILLMPGNGGDFVGSIGLGVTVALSTSYLLALTYTPAVTAAAHGLAPAHQGPPPQKPAWYRALVDAVTARPAISAALLLLLFLPLYGFLGGVERDFFPTSDRTQLIAELWLPGGATRATSLAEADRLSAALKQTEGVASVAAFVGRSAPLFYYNQVGSERDTEEYSQFLIDLAPGTDPAALARDLDARLPPTFPAAQLVVRPLGQGPVYDAPIELRVHGPDAGMRRQLTERYEQVLRAARIFSGERRNVGHDRVEAHLDVDPARAARFGLTPAQVAEALRHRLDGAPAGDLREGDREVPVVVRDHHGARPPPAHVLRTVLPGGAPVAAVGEFEVGAAVGGLARRDGQPVTNLLAWPLPGLRPAEALRRVRAELDAVALPPGYRLEYGGEEEGRQRTEGELFSTVHLAAASVVLWLFLEFERLRLVLLVLLTVPLAAGPAIFGLWLTGMPLGFTAILGLLSLTGIVLNDAILLVDGFEAARAEGVPLLQAVREVTLDRTTHVLLTSLTTIAGFLPLVKAGDEFWGPLAVTVIAGLSSITVLTLLLVPALYLLLWPAAWDRPLP